MLKTLKDIEECERSPFMFAGSESLRQAAREWVELIEKEMECLPEIAREQYLFLAGKRWALIEFFDIDEDD